MIPRKPAPPLRDSLWHRIARLFRREPTLNSKLLALHLSAAGPKSALKE